MIKKVRHYLEFLFVLAAGVAIRVLNPAQAHAFAGWLGGWVYRLGLARGLALDNLSRAFPEKDKQEIQAIAKGAYQQFAMTMVDLLRMPLIDPRELLVDFEFQDEQILEASLARGKGAVCLSGHYGNWEWMGAALVARGYPVSFMIGTQSNPWVDRHFNSFRMHCNINLIPLKNVRGVLQTLKRNQFVALLGDQDGDRWGAFLKFFGRTASTFTGPAMFARKTGADMLFAVPQRLGPRKHRVRIVRLPDPPAGLSEELDIAFRLQAYNNALEAAIRESPSQWLWMHNRWEARPEHHLAGEERARAERGEIYFDTVDQAWKSRDAAQPVAVTWIP